MTVLDDFTPTRFTTCKDGGYKIIRGGIHIGWVYRAKRGTYMGFYMSVTLDGTEAGPFVTRAAAAESIN